MAVLNSLTETSLFPSMISRSTQHNSKLKNSLELILLWHRIRFVSCSIHWKGKETVFEQVEGLLKSPSHKRMIEEDLYDIYGTHGSWNATALR